jgi:replicative DNA helicase
MPLNAQDLLAEQALIGSMLAAPSVATPAFMTLPAAAYFAEKHKALASVIQDMVAKQIPVDPITVLQQVSDLGILGRIGGGPYLISLMQATPSAINADYWAEWLSELYGRRLLHEACEREMQRLDALGEAGERTGVADSVNRLRSEMEDVLAYSAGSRAEQVTSMADFLEQISSWDWIVPGLFERRDRLVVTGDEGGGKSMLMAQISCAMAGGIHPFTSAPIPGDPEIRVTIIDCENSAGQSRRRFRDVVRRVNLLRETFGLPAADWTKRMSIEFRTDGVDLMAAHDVAWLERYVAATTPDVLVIGPLYKLHHEDMNSEPAARAMVGVLDSIRARHDCMILTEAHAGHGKSESGKRLMRPRGSSLFLGWPEFGFGIRGTDQQGCAEFVPWRGQREQRAFPQQMCWGHRDALPWKPSQEYFDEPDPGWRG